MVTALVLQLVQCIIKLPSAADNTGAGEDEDTAAQDVIITTSYEQAMKTAHHFLSVFLKKYVYIYAHCVKNMFLINNFGMRTGILYVSIVSHFHSRFSIPAQSLAMAHQNFFTYYLSEGFLSHFLIHAVYS